MILQEHVRAQLNSVTYLRSEFPRGLIRVLSSSAEASTSTEDKTDMSPLLCGIEGLLARQVGWEVVRDIGTEAATGGMEALAVVA